MMTHIGDYSIGVYSPAWQECAEEGRPHARHPFRPPGPPSWGQGGSTSNLSLQHQGLFEGLISSVSFILGFSHILMNISKNKNIFTTILSKLTSCFRPASSGICLLSFLGLDRAKRPQLGYAADKTSLRMKSADQDDKTRVNVL